MENILRHIVFLVTLLGYFYSVNLNASVELQPHRAYYTVTLEGKPDPRSSVTDVQGVMLLEFQNVPGGATIQQRSKTRLYYNDGSVEYVEWAYLTYESADGSLFKFETCRKIDEEIQAHLRGVVKRKGTALEVTYKDPKGKTLILPNETIFPTQHVKALLTAAQKGERIFPSLVFDGSSEEGASEINTFLGEKKVVAGNPGCETTHQFATQPFLPVKFAVYGCKKTDYEPLYITTQDLLPNGIIKQYVIDYGNLKIRGVLDRIELL